MKALWLGKSMIGPELVLWNVKQSSANVLTAEQYHLQTTGSNIRTIICHARWVRNSSSYYAFAQLQITMLQQLSSLSNN